MNRRKGFTILELLIVIAVIAILVGIALPSFKGMRDEGNITRAKGDLRTLSTAIQSYYIHNSAIPTSAQLLTAVPNIVGAATPKDPFVAGGATEYPIVSNGSYFVVYSVGPGAGAAPTITSLGAVTADGKVIYTTNGTADTAHPSL